MTQENTTKITDEKSAKKQAKKADAQKRKNVGGIAAISLLIALFDKLSEIICRALINGFWGSICSAYAKMDVRLSTDFCANLYSATSALKRYSADSDIFCQDI